ncbi:MAG TPA: hypothetical protein DCL73_06145 [Treponema sp.]|nr:hypothetical protein [Treponema sp.]
MKKTVAIACAAALCMTVSFAQTAGTETPAETTAVEQSADTTTQKSADTSDEESDTEELTKEEKKTAEKAAKEAAAEAAAAVKAQKTAAKKAARDAAKNSTVQKTYAVPVEGIEIIQQDMELPVHVLDYQTTFPSLSVKFSPEDATCRDVKWSSSDMKIVKVDQRGRLFPAKVGTAVITATTKDGAYTATCSVKISKYGPKPKIDAKITTELTGDASVTYGTDLDTGRSGFTTDQNIKLKINLLNLGEIWSDNSDALPIWGDIRIYTEGDPLRYYVDDDSGTDLSLNDDDDTEDGGFKIVVDHAKIHIGDAFVTLYDRDNSNLGYVNYTTQPDVAFEFIGIDTDYRYGHLDGRTLQSYLSSTDDEDTVYGLQCGYGLDNIFSVAFDFASTMQWIAGAEDTTEDTADPSHDATDWIYKISGSFDLVPNLSIKAGYSNGILGEDSVYKQDMRFGGQISYEWDFYDIYYLKPTAGCTMVQIESRGKAYPLFTAGFLLGWEDKQTAFDTWFSGTRPRYLEDDYGPYPGLAVAVEYADKKLAEDCVINDGRYDTVDHDVVILHGSFNTGNGLLLKNFEAVGAVDVIDALSDQAIIGATAGIKYWMPLGKYLSFTPKAFFTRYYDTYNDDNDYMYAKVGFEVAYQRVSMSFDYESNDLLTGFYDGEGYRKYGKLETTFKVHF